MYSCTSSDSRILVRGGNITQNVKHEFYSSPVLQWHRQNFGSGGGHSTKMYSSKTFENFENFIKESALIFKNSPKFFKIKFNRIEENLRKFRIILQNFKRF